MPTVAVSFAEEIARSGCALWDIHASVRGGNTETNGDVTVPSLKTRRDSSKTQPSSIKLCTDT
eukprot:CAMPEP_0172747342 /NCGR_PEP_ID=MMETSP1074-20121228/142572_1 /TAXON_ID=2916 /ORGANISM="Ceratium fusus, Strain PA161109" /LENGTH=62 /DNA_ID=CAMNT_0013578843 /DNA_START=88 /DNA_END=272 /DNA_ORIENTATION=+